VNDQDPYVDFAARYDAFERGAEGDHAARDAFFRELFADHGVRSILDCACGTGSDLLRFRSLGLDVTGSDVSEAMLDETRRKLAEAGEKVPLLQTDFRRLVDHFPVPFDAVACLSTSLPHLHEDAEILRALRSMRDVLREGGVLVIDQGMTDRQWMERRRFFPVVQTADLSRLMVIDYAEEAFTIHVVDFVHRSNESAFHVDRFTYRKLLRDDYVRLLEVAGFRSVRLYGSFGFDAYDPDESRRLIVVAVR